MKTRQDHSHEGTLDSASRTRMTFDEDSAAHLMAILTDLYSDPALAVIREYSTNALDSHRAAGNPDPIQVELPTEMNPTFTVKDQGVGLSVDEIINNFSKYGWSSKRDTDEEVGMLGLGCKSALSYTPQFTITAVKNGIQAIVLVSRADDGGGAIQVVDTAATDLPNGVTVTIPVTNAYLFNAKAKEFYRFWEKGTVLVDGEPPENQPGVSEDDLKLDDDVWIMPSLGQSFVVMGNVSYPVDFRQAPLKTLSNRTRTAMIRVPIGTVDFTPSREALHYTRRTIDTLHEADAFIAARLRATAEQEVAQAPTATDAILAARRWRAVVTGTSFRYCGKNVPYQVRLHDPTYSNDTGKVFSWQWSSRDYTNKADRTCSFMAESAVKALWVTNHPGNTVKRDTKDRVGKICELAGLERRHVIFHPGIRYKDEYWFDGVEQIDYQELAKIPLPTVVKVPRAPRQPNRMYSALNAGDRQFREVPSLPAKTIVVFVRAAEDPTRGYQVLDWDGLATPGVTIVRVNKRQEKWFGEAHPHAIHISVWAAWLAHGRYKALTTLDKLGTVGESRTWWKFVEDVTVLADPDFGIFDQSRGSHERLMAWKRAQNFCSRLGMHIQGSLSQAERDKARTEVVNLEKKYPMLTLIQFGYQHQDTEQIEIVIDYLNSTYKSIQSNPTLKETAA